MNSLKTAAALCALLTATPAFAQHDGHGGHDQHQGHGATPAPAPRQRSPNRRTIAGTRVTPCQARLRPAARLRGPMP